MKKGAICIDNYYYILKGKKVAMATNVSEWGKWFETADRIVKRQTLKNGLDVSTIFLGLNHNFLGRGKPVLFETMVFTPEKDAMVFGKKRKVRDDLAQDRCCTWEEAEKMHKKMVRKFKNYNYKKEKK